MPRVRVRLTLALVTVALLALPVVARANLVTNGDFETGNLSGWQTQDTSGGLWEAYSGTLLDGMFPVPAPPQGSFAAITEEGDPSQLFLYQDVTLPPQGAAIGLSMFAYYTAYADIVSPDDLSAFPNEQYRIDVMKPSAPIDSVASGDILATVFRTVAGDPLSLGPTKKTADLSAFAGQTVRLRLANVVTEDEMNAGADAVLISTLTLGKPKPNEGNGTAKLPVTVTDPGTVTLTGKGVKRRSAPSSKAVSTGGGKVKLLVKPKGKTESKLNQSGKASVKVTVTYTPNGGSPITKKKKLKLKES